MAIWTSRYSNKELQNGNYYTVGISIGQPKFQLGYTLDGQCYSLAPKGYMMNMDLERFKVEFYDKLEKIGKQRIIDMVLRLEREAKAVEKELVLLCYEDIRNEEDWCHRTVFAEWWLENMGEIIEELPDSSEPRNKRKNTEAVSTVPATTPKNVGGSYVQMSIFDMSSMAGV